MSNSVEPAEFKLPLLVQHARPGSFRLAVDLSTMRPGGENGGVKLFALEFLSALARLEGENLSLIFLTWSCSHAEVRTIARPWDLLVCVRHTEGETPAPPDDWQRGDVKLLNPPADLLLQLDAAALYSPLSSSEFACPGVPLITTIVDVLHRDYPATLTPALVASREANFRLLVRATTMFQCISDHTAGRLSAHYAVSPDRLFRTYIVIQHRLSPPPGDRSAGHRPYFLYPANAWKHKNHETLLVSYRLYRRAAGRTSWDLVLTGHEDERMNAIRSTAAALGLGPWVKFRGHLEPAEFAALWRAAGALVFPSLHEGFGIPLLEAMHFGLPILCNNAGSLPEVGTDAAIYADARNPEEFAQGLVRLASDPGLRAELVARGRRRLGDFSMSHEATEMSRRLRLCTTGEPLLWAKGVHPDGWMERQAIIALPRREGVSLLTIDLAPAPAARHLRVCLGRTPFGGFDLPGGQPHRVSLDVRLGGIPLVLEVPDAGNLNPRDHRSHGVLLSGVSVTDPKGRTQALAHVLP